MDIRLSALNNFGEIWKPRKFQVKATKIFKTCQRLFLLIPRQFGKTDWCAHIVRDFAFFYEKHRNPTCLIIMQTYDSVNKNYLTRLRPMFEKLPPSLVTIYENRSSEHAWIKMKRPWLGDTITIHFASASSDKAVKALRGRTVHLMILDEAAFYPDSAWTAVLSPMLDDTGGKAILTSTVNGPNWFMDMDVFAARQQQEQTGNYGHYKLNAKEMLKLEPELRPEGWLEEKRKEYEALGKLADFWQEYFHDYYAGSKREYPLGETLSRMPNGGVINPYAHDPSLHTMYIQCDIGKAGNYATWGFIFSHPPQHLPVITHYSDEHDNIPEFIAAMYEKFKHYKQIKITFPHDIFDNNKGDRGNFWDLVRKIVRENPRYRNKIVVKYLKRPINVKNEWYNVVHSLPRFRFVASQCGVGYEKIRRFRFSKDSKTGQVVWGTAVRNGHQHAADGMRYTVEAEEKYRSEAGRQGLHAHVNMISEMSGSKYNTDSKYNYRKRRF